MQGVEERLEELAAGRVHAFGIAHRLAGLVEHERVGTRNLYALAPEGLVPLQQWLVGTWDRALAAFADHVTAHTQEGSRAATDPS